MERSVEYRGDAARSFSTDMRFTICNMTAEFGGLNGIFEADEHGRRVARAPPPRLQRRRALLPRRRRRALRRALSRSISASLAPQVAKPFSPDNVFDVTELAGQPARRLLHRRLHDHRGGAGAGRAGAGGGARRTARAGSRPRAGGASSCRATCGSRSTSARRACGRSTSARASRWIRRTARCAWASPAARPARARSGSARRTATSRTAWARARSPGSPARPPSPPARSGCASPTRARCWSAWTATGSMRSCCAQRNRSAGRDHHQRAARSQVGAATQAGESQRCRGRHASARTVQRFGDAVDTDAIIPGEFCHLTDLEALGEKAFHYVRPEFRERAKGGATIVVAGEGWGSGSSREQAVWALQGRRHPGRHRQELRLHPQAQSGQRGAAVSGDPRRRRSTTLADEGAELEIDLASGVVRDVASGASSRRRSPRR